MLGDGVFIADTHYRFDDPNRPISEQGLADPKPVRIGSGCHIGVRAMIAPGVTLGENAYVGAAAVVTEDVPARAVVVGDPARIVRRYDPDAGWLNAVYAGLARIGPNARYVDAGSSELECGGRPSST